MSLSTSDSTSFNSEVFQEIVADLHSVDKELIARTLELIPSMHPTDHTSLLYSTLLC